MLIINDFTAYDNQVDTLEIKVTSDSAITAASIIYTDGSVEDILSKFVPAGPPNEYVASVPATPPMSTKDGVFTLDVSNSAENMIVSIGNLLLASQLLLDKTIRKEFDWVLMQNIEGVRQLILANEGDLARAIYYDLQKQAASCSSAPMLDYHIEKTEIWIVDNLYTIQ